MSPRPRREHLRRPEILDAAVDAVRDRGLHRVRLSDVAERLGVTRAMPLYYWDSKDELLDDALMHGDHRFWAELGAELSALPTASRRLERLLYRCSLVGMWPIWIELWSRALRSPQMAIAQQQVEQAFRDTLAGIVRQGMAGGEFATVDVERVVSGISALLDGCAVQVVLDDFAMPVERLQATLLEVTGRLVGVQLVLEPWPPDAGRARLSRPSAQRAQGGGRARRAVAGGQARRAEILAAAGEVVRARGLAGTRVSDIAARLGVSAAGPLYDFDSLQQLLEEALAKVERDWFAALRGELEGRGAAAQLAHVVERSIPDDPEDGTWPLWIELWAHALRHTGMAAVRARLDGEWRELLVGIVARGRAAGEFAAGDPAHVALTLACLLDGYGTERVLGSDALPADARAGSAWTSSGRSSAPRG